MPPLIHAAGIRWQDQWGAIDPVGQRSILGVASGKLAVNMAPAGPPVVSINCPI